MSRRASVARVTAKPGSFDALLMETRRFLAQIDAEQGTELFAVNIARDMPNTLWFYEIYRDEDAFEAHVSSDAMRAYAAVLDSLAESEIEVHSLEPDTVRASGPVAKLSEGETGR